MWEVREGDCLELLRAVEPDSVDLVATDPPYGIAFMGKDWDKGLPDPAVWRECLRVLKPGGSAVVMSGARLDCLWRMCRDLEEAGFELSQTAFFWCYRSGFPKGGDLSKLADKAAGAEREVVGRSRDFCPGRKRTFGDGNCLGTQVGTDEEPDWLTAPSSPLAVALSGWYTKGKVKPAVEVIIWARKPISERTELANMARWGVGGVNCGECMVPFGEGGPWTLPQAPRSNVGFKLSPGNEERMGFDSRGRFPANLLVTDAALGAEDSRYFDVSRWAEEHGYSEDWAAAAEAGVLQVAKPSRAEKNAGLSFLPEQQAIGGGGTNNTEDDVCGKYGSIKAPQNNPHPTCKPVTLFAYLASFLARPGALVLDPFCGSGTTGVACVNTGRDFIGMELEPQYVEIARARIAHAEREQAAKQPTLALDCAGK